MGNTYIDSAPILFSINDLTRGIVIINFGTKAIKKLKVVRCLKAPAL